MSRIACESIVSTREKSKLIYEDSCRVIPGGVNSPVRAFPDVELPPIVVERGEGDMLFDADGNSYIDYCMSWGALLHGHADPRIVEAAIARVKLGSSFGAVTPTEEKLASAIIRHMPSIDKLRFVSSGTEATMSALRLARGYTGKKKIIKFIGNFHGHHDQLLVQAGSGLATLNATSSSKGVPPEMIQNTLCLPYNDIETLKRTFEREKEIAAVIFEPIVGNMGVVPASPAFFRALRDETRSAGALLIVDEVITGFRVGRGGAQSLYGIAGDLTCLGKIIGGGFPAAAFGGKKEIMDHLAPLGEVYQGGTLSGNPVAMAAGLAAIQALEEPNFYEQLQQKTDRLLASIEEEIQRRNLPCCINRVGSMFTLFFGKKEVTAKASDLDLARFKEFFTYLFERGIYFPPSQYEAAFVSMAHTDEHLDDTREILLNFFRDCN